MRGNISIVCNESGVHLACNVSECRYFDKVFLVHALGKALHLESDDYLILAGAEAVGALDPNSPTGITVDTDELKKQMEEEEVES